LFDRENSPEHKLLFVELLLIGLALSMDAFAVTAANAVAYPRMPLRRSLLIPLSFALWQGLMPILGYFLGGLAQGLIERFSGPIACAILCLIGIKMIWEGLRDQSQNNPQKATAESSLSLPNLLAQSVATSIDAFVVGVGFAALSVEIWLAATIIALTTATCCLLALSLGKRFGQLLGTRAVIIGGVVLVVIGIKSLL
jgi:putative Mn2+ efflux pump MntP